MAQRRSKMSKKEFDDQFEAFLKESMSSEESMDSSRVAKYLNPPKKEKHWWMEQDDDDEQDIGRGLTASGKSFFKKKKPEPESSTPIREDQTTSIRDKKPDLDSSDDGKKIISPADRRAKTKREMKAKGVRGKTDNSMSKDSLEDISEKSEEESTKMNDKKGLSGTKSSTGPSHRAGKNTMPGMETLDEIAEKEKFFQDLEKNATGGTLDYSRLNRDLSQSATTMSPEGAAKAAATLAALEDIEQEDGSLIPPPKSEPVTDHDPSIQKPSMLSKVSLMDSMDSTMNTTGSPKIGGTLQEARKSGLDDVDGHLHVQQSTPGSFKTGTGEFNAHMSGFMGTNTSNEIEALHKALREVGLSPTIKNDSQALDSSMANNSELLQKILSAEPEKGKHRTVEEVLQEMDNIEKQSQSRHDQDDVQLLSEKRKSPANGERKMEEIRGFGLSPIQPDNSSPRGFDQSHTEDTEMYQPVTQISISERGRTKKKNSKEKGKTKSKKSSPSSPGRSLSPRSSPRRWMSPRSNTMKLDERSRSLSPTKAGSTLKNKYNHIKSSGYGQQSPGRTPSKERPSSARERGTLRTEEHRGAKHGGKDRAPERAGKKERRLREVGQQEQPWSPVDISRQKIIGTQSPKQSQGHHPGLDSQLRVSIDSFAAYITDHFSPTKAMPRTKFSENEPALSASWKGDKSVEDLPIDLEELQKLVLSEKTANQNLREELENSVQAHERELEKQKLGYEEEIHKLKQENYVLSAKIPGDKEKLKKQVMNGAPGEISTEQMERLKKDLQEQENLIAGYQQENQRLYDQVKGLQKQAKVTEERMFSENQRLQTELTNLRAKSGEDEGIPLMKTRVLESQQGNPDVNLALGMGQIAELEAELREHKRREVTMKRELEISQRTKIELDQQMDKLIKERELLHEKLEKASYPEDIRKLEDRYKEETERLNRKLKWYAENQKLLDQDTKKLKAKEEEITKLKSRIQDLQSETGKRLEDNRMRSTERAKDAKKIQDLQRQVKEMEQIMKRRHPNSLPSLMMTAAVIPEEHAQSPLVTVLEGRVRKLEQELESRQKEEDKMLRAVEQKYNNIKLKYEERIGDLETQLAAYHRPDDMNLKSYEHPHTHAVALQQELDAARERYKKQVVDLEGQISQLTAQLQKVQKNQEVPKNEMQASKEKEVELSSRLQLLQLELNTKNHDIQVLHKSLERLRKEKQATLVNGLSLDKKKKKHKDETGSEKETEVLENHEKEPCDHSDEIYKLAQENEGLRAKMDELQLEAEHSRLKVHKVQAEHEAYVRRSREKYEEKIEALCQSHQKELQQMLAEQALEHSASKTAQLHSKVNAQEVMIQHLREQLTAAQVELEQLSVMKIKEASHQTRIEKLQEELRDAKKYHSPGMKHFEQIEDKILSIEKKHENRERELQQVIQKSKDSHTQELEQQTAKWKQVVEVKNQEIQRFRVELDAILDVLRLLQKQGVVLPVRTSHVYS
ncbi:centrosomal protein of 162 kDa-like isoform X3 [Ostrea edulis]|uniref:centrosomal protein of 162 kDa-like isoform X3 n=1 Tax=Ostrea edulis TaxID=37623 RepID=UPI0024AF92BB|nr:centrosomal protein of 162 kDa-like isoform X3 [Ostrea edulis]